METLKVSCHMPWSALSVSSGFGPPRGGLASSTTKVFCVVRESIWLVVGAVLHFHFHGSLYNTGPSGDMLCASGLSPCSPARYGLGTGASLQCVVASNTICEL